MLFGWGLFNVAEGLVDHHLLGSHHVRQGADQTDWDLGFLALGAVLLIAGWLLTRDRDGHVARERVLERGHVHEDADAALSHDDAAQPRVRRVPDDGR